MSKQKFPEPTVGGFIFNSKGEIFLMKSHKWRHKYVVPGGHIELGETMEQALKREIKEETGLNIFDLEFLNLKEFIFDKAFAKKKHFLFLNFIAKTKSSKVVLNEEAQEYIFIDPK
ncbi:MAG: NUDIX domain-containing protein, partial [Candidatus Parcubacteria bacterium]|nr:NUDIX domain-containing protein [Candidatus Parcubacteria bacterium]